MARIITIEGTGLLSGTFDLDKLEAEQKEERRKQEATAKREQAQAQTCAEIEDYVSRNVTAELAAENADTIRWFKAEFDLFRQCCDRWDLPCLPAPPQAVAVFLIERSEQGTAHLEHLCRAIAAAHRAKDLPNPCDDLLVKAVMRLCRKEEMPSPDGDKTQKETNNEAS